MYALSVKQSVTFCLCSFKSYIITFACVIVTAEYLGLASIYVNQIGKIWASLNFELLILPEMQLEQMQTMPFHSHVPVRYYKIYSYNTQWLLE